MVTTTQVNCLWCHKEITKSLSEIKRHSNSFCNRKCNANYQNSARKINTLSKQIQCKICNLSLLLNHGSAKKSCDSCIKNRNKETRKKYDKILKPSYCILCKKFFLCSRGKAKYCPNCYHTVRHNIGVKAAASQQRRSKNEIYMAQLCAQHFGNVTTNEPFFISKYGNWDADIILHDYKIAILWNGAWHYQKVTRQHSLSQVQARDKIKLDTITNNGYFPYVIEDRGKFNKQFVEEQFIKLKDYLYASNQYQVPSLRTTTNS